MLDFLESESSSPGSKSGDPVMAAIKVELDDGGRSPLDFSAESSEVEDIIVPMSGPDPLELDKPIGEDEFVRQARRKGTDPLTGSKVPEGELSVLNDKSDEFLGEKDPLISDGEEAIEEEPQAESPIQTRARKYVYVSSPSRNSTLEPGKRYNIRWSDNFSDNVKLELYKGSSFKQTISSSTYSDGSYYWTVPTSLSSGSDYKLKIRNVNDSRVYDYSDTFKIQGKEIVNLTYPSRNSTLEPGKRYNIRWSDNFSDNVRLELYKGSSLKQTISSSTYSDGSYSWTVPTSLSSGSDYKLKIRNVNDSRVYDYSDTFKIQGNEVIKLGNGKNIPSSNWKAEFINRNSRDYNNWSFNMETPSGKLRNPADAVADLGSQNSSGKQIASLKKNFGLGSPTDKNGRRISGVQSDYYAMLASTRVNLKAGKLYKVVNKSDDGFGFHLKKAWRNDSGAWIQKPGGTEAQDWRDRASWDPAKTTVFSVDQSGQYDFFVKYYEKEGHSVIDVKLEEVPVQESVNEDRQWLGWVSKWDGGGKSSPSPVNFNEALSKDPGFELMGTVNLGSNIREIFNDGRKGINKADWGSGSVNRNPLLPKDNFVVKGYTKANLEGGKTYEFEAKGDDGFQIWLKNLGNNKWYSVTPENQWQNTVGQSGTYKKRFYVPEGGQYYVGFFHYENKGDASFGLNWKEAPLYEERTTGSDWRSSFYRFDGNQPSVNFHENEANKLAILNLGPSKGKEFRGNWGSGSPKNSEYIPNDNFAVRSYTHAYFKEGQKYEFHVKADDGYQIFAKRHGTNDWFDVTTKNQWSTDAYNGKTISHTWQGPTGDYDLHFQHYEAGGDAYFNLDWKEVSNDFKVPLPAGKWKITQGVDGSGWTGDWPPSHHNDFAIDFDDGKPGVPVLAAASGTVIKSVTNYKQGKGQGYGNHVKIDHGNGYQTLYGHFKDSPMVQPGQSVNQGDQLGIIGTTGYSTGTHLHFEVFYNGSSHESVPQLQNFTLDGRKLSDYRPGAWYQSTNS